MTQPRKGAHCALELKTLLRDAQPTRAEICDPNPYKRKQNIRAKEIATDELLKIYRDHERRGRLSQLDAEVRVFCDQLKMHNDGQLPKRKGGRPSNDHQNLLIAVRVVETLEAQTTKRKNITQAIRYVHETLVINGKRLVVPIATIRDIHYRSDPEWRRALKAEIDWRKKLAWRRSESS